MTKLKQNVLKVLKLRLKIAISGVLIVSLAVALVNVFSSSEEQILETGSSAMSDGRWTIVNRFDGYQTKPDPAKVSNGANPLGQNTIVNDGDRISVREQGIEILGTASSTSKRVETLHTFRRRDGEQILIKTFANYVQYYEELNDTWETLISTSSSAIYDFEDYNINADLRSYVYFGNAVDSAGRWSGAHTLISTTTTSTATFVFADDTQDFTDTGSIVYCGVKIDYTAVADNGFDVASAHVCAADRSITQSHDDLDALPVGNIYLAANNRLWISGIASTTQAVFFSKYGDPTDFVGADLIVDGTDTSPGIFNLGEGGGGVNGMVFDEQSIYIFKKSLIYKATLTDTLYTIVPLKAFDGKSQTIGGTNNKSTFTSNNGVLFITPDNQIMNLSRIADFDYPQITPISELIKPTTDTAIFASSTGIFWKNKGYISVKSDSDSINNDAIFVYNQRLNAWESPIIGWTANDFAIYDDGDGEELYVGSSYAPDVYKVTDEAIDNELGVTANYRTKRFDLGLPHQLKEIENVYVEGYITDNTTLSISLLLDEDGFTQTYSTEIDGTDTDYQYNAEPYNTFGFHPFGYLQFGSANQEAKKKFRVYLNKNLRRTPFYTYQLEFASDDVGQYWEVTNYGVKWRVSSQDEDGSLYKAW